MAGLNDVVVLEELCQLGGWTDPKAYKAGLFTPPGQTEPIPYKAGKSMQVLVLSAPNGFTVLKASAKNADDDEGMARLYRIHEACMAAGVGTMIKLRYTVREGKFTVVDLAPAAKSAAA